MDYLKKIDGRVIAVVIILIVLVVYFLYARKRKEKVGDKNKKKKLPNIESKKKEDDDEEDEENETLVFAKKLHAKLHSKLSRDECTLDEFKELTNKKLDDVVYTEFVQLYSNTSDNDADPASITPKEYVAIIQNHIEK